MPSDYMQTVQLLERFLCDLHISEICECSSVFDANNILLECLTENVTYKEHILDFCERLLLIKSVSQLTRVVENLRECKYTHTYIPIIHVRMCTTRTVINFIDLVMHICSTDYIL